MAFLLISNTFRAVFSKYANVIDIFYLEFVAKFPKYIQINNHLINLVDGQQPSHKPIYSLKSVKLKILKMYIKIKLINNFIQTFKLLVRASIFFVLKLNDSL